MDTKMLLADTNPTLRQWITNNHMLPVLRIHEKTIRFEGTQIRDYPFEPDHLIIRDIKTVHRFLKHFGHLITKVALIGPSYHDAHTTEISQLIAVHCSNNLREIDLRESGTYLISDTNATFPNVLNVKLDYYNFADVNLQIHRIFPAMEQLIVDIGAVSTTEPGTHFDAILAHVCYSLRSIENLRSLNLRKPRVSMLDLQVINENLPNLVNLNVQAPIRTDNEYSVHFRNVNNFTCSILEYVGHDQPCPITFDHLETLRISSLLSKSTHMAFKLIEQNSQLKSLSMPLVGSEIMLNGLINRIQTTHNLVDMEMKWNVMRDRNEPLPDFSGFQRMTFVIRNGNEKMEERESVMEKLPGEWTVVDETKEESKVSRANDSFIKVERIM